MSNHNVNNHVNNHIDTQSRHFTEADGNILQTLVFLTAKLSNCMRNLSPR